MALADDSEGVAINPASVALRLPYSWTWWDYGFGVDFSVGAWLPKNDLYNQGTSEGSGKSSALFGSLAAVLYAGHFGAGVSAEAQSNAASRPQSEQGVGRNFGANFGMVHSSAGYGFIDNQLLFGVGARLVGMSFDRHSDSGALSTAGVGFTGGVTVKPAHLVQHRILALSSARRASSRSVGLSERPAVLDPSAHVPSPLFRTAPRSLGLPRWSLSGRGAGRAVPRPAARVRGRHLRRGMWSAMGQVALRGSAYRVARAQSGAFGSSIGLSLAAGRDINEEAPRQPPLAIGLV